MSGPKIMVFQMKQILKIGAIILAAIVVLCFLIFYFGSRNKAAEGVYLPGTYAAQIILHNEPVDIEVTVTDKEITGVGLYNMSEIQETFYPLFKPTMNELSEQILKYQSTKIATTSENAVTSRILLDAVDVALAQASVAQTINN